MKFGGHFKWGVRLQLLATLGVHCPLQNVDFLTFIYPQTSVFFGIFFLMAQEGWNKDKVNVE